MKQRRYFFIMVLSAAFFCSCYSPRYVYSPVAHNVPLLKKKGDSKLAGHYSTNLGEKNSLTSYGKINKGNGLDVQAAYAISNHFAVQAAFAQRWEKNYADYNQNTADTSIITYSRKSTDIGIGYYTIINSRRQSIFQVFAGVSLGNSAFTDRYITGGNINNRYLRMDVTRWYIQPAIMFWGKENFASSFSSRLSVVQFHTISTDYSAEEMKNYQLENLDQTAEIFWEPAFINAFGLKKIPGIKIEIQLVIAFLMSQRFVDYRTLNFSAGLVLDIPKFFARKKAL